MKPIRLGDGPDGKPFHLDLKIALRTRFLVQAASGGGKSRTLRRFAEQFFGKVQTFVIDKEGEFPSLREKFGYVLAGKGGETPADPRSAELLCHRLLEHHRVLRADLMETGDVELVENNYWNDTFWGVCRGKGQNLLGKILMEIRAELRK